VVYYALGVYYLTKHRFMCGLGVDLGLVLGWKLAEIVSSFAPVSGSGFRLLRRWFS